MKKIGQIFIIFILLQQIAFSNNQTNDNSPILSDESLPYTLNIRQSSVQLPEGNHSGAVGKYKNYIVIIAGRKNGLHGFTDVGSFPVEDQNIAVFVLDLGQQKIFTRKLNEDSSGLNQAEIETLAVSDSEYFQNGYTLYLIGGYGYNSSRQAFDTKPSLTAINLPGLINWVINNQSSVKANIKQLTHPLLQVAGGSALKIGNIIYLIFGQNFTGEYASSSNGIYTQQMRRFIITDSFNIQFLSSIPENGSDNFRRRDFNLLPAIYDFRKSLVYGFVQFSGVFTDSEGAWTIPVTFKDGGQLEMKDTSDPSAFKQGMNLYKSAGISLYSRKNRSMYNILFGGLTYQYYDNGTLITDSEIPYSNQVITIKMNANGDFTEHLMSSSIPTIPAPTSLGYFLFGTSSYFIPNNISAYPNNVLNFDAIRRPTVIGYIVGGIQSTVRNTTNSATQTKASTYIFEVTLTPK